MLVHVAADNLCNAVLNILDFLSGRINTGTSRRHLHLLLCELPGKALVEGK